MIIGECIVYDGRGGIAAGLRLDDGVITNVYAKRPAHIDLSLDGASIVPGLTDTHLHLAAIGQARTMADLTRADTLEEVAQRLHSIEPDQTGTLFGRSFEAKLAPVDRAWFSRHFGQVRVVLLAADLHSAWVSPQVFRDAGVDESSSDPANGRFLRLPDGSLSGFVIDGALDRLAVRFAVDDPLRVESLLRAGLSACVDAGLHGVHEIATTITMWRALQRLDLADDLPIRVTAYGYGDRSDWEREDISYRSPKLSFGGFKVFLDGALGSRGAHLEEPYSDLAADAPDCCGISLCDDESLLAWWRCATERRLQLAVHAIGDRAVRRALNIPHHADRGLRIEHAQVVNPSDYPRFAGLVAAMQPHHRRDDASLLPPRLGSRAGWAFPMTSLSRAGATVCFGSDAPVSTLSPFAGMAAAREAGVNHPLAGYTVAAELASRSDRSGALEVGAVADFLVLDGTPERSEAQTLERWTAGVRRVL